MHTWKNIIKTIQTPKQTDRQTECIQCKRNSPKAMLAPFQIVGVIFLKKKQTPP